MKRQNPIVEVKVYHDANRVAVQVNTHGVEYDAHVVVHKKNKKQVQVWRQELLSAKLGISVNLNSQKACIVWDRENCINNLWHVTSLDILPYDDVTLQNNQYSNILKIRPFSECPTDTRRLIVS